MSVLFFVGGMVCTAGLLAEFFNQRACQRIVKATLERDDTLTHEETWLNTRMREKRNKLQRFAGQDDDPLVQRDAKLALKLERLKFALFFPGMVLMLIGANQS